MPAKADSWAYASTAHWTGSSTRPGDHPEVEAAALTDSASRIRANNAWPEPTRAREMLREQQLSHQLGVRCPSDACGADGGQTCTLSPAILVPEELIVTMDLEPPVSVGHGARPQTSSPPQFQTAPRLHRAVVGGDAQCAVFFFLPLRVGGVLHRFVSSFRPEEQLTAHSHHPVHHRRGVPASGRTIVSVDERRRTWERRVRSWIDSLTRR